MEIDNKIYGIIIFLIRASLVYAILSSIWNLDWIVLFISSITLILTYFHILFERKYKVRIPIELEIISIIFIYGTIFLGELHGFYTRFWWWDLVLHTGSALAFGIIGFMIMYVLYANKKITSNLIIIILFSFCFAVSIGVIWEVFEFSMDSIFGLNMQKSGLVDTMWDLIVDIIGGLIASISGYLYLKKGDVLFLGESLREFKRDNPNLFIKNPKA